MTERYEIAVIGLGLVGGAAVRHLASSGRRVIGIGPAEPQDRRAHDTVFASHYDSGRITRRIDPELEWAELARRSICQYPVLAQASGVTFHEPVGTLWVDRDPARLRSITDVAEKLGVRAEQFGAFEAVALGYVVPDGYQCVFEPGPAGYLDPRRMLRAQLSVAHQGGAALVKDVVVERTVKSGVQRLRTAAGLEVIADRVLVATGAYAAAYGILPVTLRLRVKTETVMLARVSEDDARRRIPSLIYELDHDELDDLYLVPPTEYPGGVSYVKVGANTRSDVFLADRVAMNRWLQTGDSDRHRDAFVEVLGELLPDLEIGEVRTDRCLVSYTAHGRPYVDEIGDGVVVAVGGNGKGAKSADAIGKLGADLVSTGEWTDPLPRELFAVAADEPLTGSGMG